ncbi:unnamed protein product [Choristocarpus tenellus]
MVDGKIRIWPIVDTKVAQHSSKHCPKGTKVLVPTTVDGEMYNNIMVEDAIPAIKVHMPRPEGHTIFVQQDRAKPHTTGRTMEAIKELAGDHFPANSSDLNVNYLGFFHPIQQLKEDVEVTNIGKLVEAMM